MRAPIVLLDEPYRNFTTSLCPIVFGVCLRDASRRFLFILGATMLSKISSKPELAILADFLRSQPASRRGLDGAVTSSMR